MIEVTMLRVAFRSFASSIDLIDGLENCPGLQFLACHYRKLRPDTRISFDQLVFAEAGVLIDSPSYHGDWEESRPGRSVPQKARPRARRAMKNGLIVEKMMIS
jgi:hypothetical protein